jgi:hypothetical protein
MRDHLGVVDRSDHRPDKSDAAQGRKELANARYGCNHEKARR